MKIDTLYHWSPSENRESIRKNGIRINSDCVDEEYDHKPNYICLATTPWRGWNLLPIDPVLKEEWDLWQVEIDDNDKIKIRGDLGTIIQEIRVFNTISANKVWFVGNRNEI